MNHPTSRDIRSRLAPSQAAVGFSAAVKFEAEATISCKVPTLRIEPGSLQDAEFKTAAENDAARRKKFEAGRR